MTWKHPPRKPNRGKIRHTIVDILGLLAICAVALGIYIGW